MEKKTENEMDTWIMLGVIGITGVLGLPGDHYGCTWGRFSP